MHRIFNSKVINILHKYKNDFQHLSDQHRCESICDLMNPLGKCIFYVMYSLQAACAVRAKYNSIQFFANKLFKLNCFNIKTKK